MRAICVTCGGRGVIPDPAPLTMTAEQETAYRAMADKRLCAPIGDCWNAIDVLADELDAARTRLAAAEAELAALREVAESEYDLRHADPTWRGEGIPKWDTAFARYEAAIAAFDAARDRRDG